MPTHAHNLIIKYSIKHVHVCCYLVLKWNWLGQQLEAISLFLPHTLGLADDILSEIRDFLSFLRNLTGQMRGSYLGILASPWRKPHWHKFKPYNIVKQVLYTVHIYIHVCSICWCAISCVNALLVLHVDLVKKLQFWSLINFHIIIW